MIPRVPVLGVIVRGRLMVTLVLDHSSVACLRLEGKDVSTSAGFAAQTPRGLLSPS